MIPIKMGLVINEGEYDMAQESSSDNSHLLTLLPLINKTVFTASSPKDLGYTKTQYIIFTTLYTCENLTMSQVASYISSSKEQATRAVAPLVDDGLIERYVDPENRTKIHIRLTEKGMDFMAHHKKIFFKNVQELLKEHLSDDEIIELKQAVEVIIQLLSKVN